MQKCDTKKSLDTIYFRRIFETVPIAVKNNRLIDIFFLQKRVFKFTSRWWIGNGQVN